MTTYTWHVNIHNECGPFMTASFDTRGKAAAYAMRWNRKGAPYKAVILRVQNPAPWFGVPKTQEAK